MPLKNKLVAFIVSVVMCASFVPALALADVVDGEQQPDVVNEEQEHGAADEAGMAAQADDEEAAEMTAQVAGGQLVFQGATGVSENVLSYEGGFKVEVTPSAAGTWNGTNLTLPNSTPVTFKFMPPEGYGGNASLVIDGTAIPFEGGVLTFNADFSSKTAIVVELNAEAGPQGTRMVKLTFDEASLPMLSVDKTRFTIGYGDQYDQEFNTNGAEIEVSEDTRRKTILGFAITNKYFIPTAIVNGKTYETFDSGTSTDPAVANLCVELTGADADVDSFTVNLSIGARANVDLQAQNVNRVEATYMTVDQGKALMSDITSDVGLSVADTSLDSAVPNAVATFDLGAQVDNETVSKLESPLDVTMIIDTNTYTGTNYVVVSNHEGTVTELPTEYDAATGRLKFPASEFSDYSLVDKGASSSDTKATAKTTVAKTGDPLKAAGMLVIALAACGIAVFATRRLSDRA